jgi:YidC/Oxa1 family membrane protein insertase
MLPVAGITDILQPLIDFCESIMSFFHDSAGFSWGLSIIFLTFVIRLLILPLTFKQVRSMQSLQRLQPEIKKLQARYKDDRQRMNQEMMRFYKENKINPAASCLPMVLQIPIFISLFYVLRHFDERVLPDYVGSSVQWLHLVDITEPVKDGWGPLLLVIYVASQLSSSYFMSSTMQGAQRILLMVLPVLFVPFIINFPAGLMLYWLTTNLWTTGQGLVTRRLMPKPELPEKRSSRTPAKDEPPPQPASGNGSGNGNPKAVAVPARKPVAGPPRRVKRKKGGGGAKR